MNTRVPVDAAGAVALIGFSLLLGFNQVVIKVGNDGFQPVFAAALRSLGAAALLLAWMRWRGVALRIEPGSARLGLLLGGMFSLEFLLLFTALDLTTVSRTSVIFYTMPVWTTLAAHFLLAGEHLSAGKLAGLAMAFVGVALALTSGRPAGGEASLAGDLCALGASFCWTGIALTARAPAMGRVSPEMQLLWQTAVSGPLLLVASLAFGPLIRELAPIHVAGLVFQIVAVAFAGFLLWFWLLARYRAGQVAAFGFLSPIFGTFLGWALLGDHVGPSLLAAVVLVALGLLLINRPAGGFRFRRTSA
ncbi:DMT family transporter [Oceaniglobus roseus]|uniref:DMT family transporter n=1 Tax=Oceaniglobus roseus TaxID=1737570 RepID=UPI000C7EE708|nr:DMT family transporter [Kandeliimicrobium roseum]